MNTLLLKLGFISFMLIALVGCQTTSESRSNVIGAQGSSNSRSDFNRDKAAQIRLSAGLQYLKQGNLQNAKRHLDKALELGDDSGNVHFGLAYYFEHVKEFKRAEKYYKRALRLEKKNPDFLNGYASFLCNRKKYEEAEKYFTKAISQPIYPDIASAYMNAGVCAKKSKNLVKASSYFRKALNRNKKLATALIEMAQLEYDKKRYKRALSYVQRFEAVSRPSSNSLWIALRVAHYLKLRDDKASYIIKLEQMFPDSDETAAYLDGQEQWK